MTVDEVIADGPRRTRQFGSSAAGLYQVMKDTLRTLKAQMGLTGRELFTADLQDQLGYQLLKQRGYASFMAGNLSVTGFGLNLAKEWASFPVLAAQRGQHRQVARGQSYYAGDGLNKALVKPEAVEAMLRSLRVASVVSVADADLVSEVAAPRVETSTATAHDTLPWWARLLGRNGAPPISRPGLHPKGNPELYDVQKALRDRAYYTKGKLDGLDGPLTQEAVAQARKDNGLADGGVDADFLAAMPGFPQRPVAAERLTMPLREAAKQRPEVFSPVKWLGSLGIGAIGLGGANGTGLIDNLQSTASKANDVFGTVQTVFGFVGSGIGFVVEHRTMFLIGLGLVLIWKALSVALDAWIKVRRAFF
ncbi:peptidoglycan-binding protein [Methylobacterium komagatae]